MKSRSCPNKHRPPSGKGDVGAIIRHGFYTTRGKRRRYQCQTCGRTFCSTSGTPYYRLQHRRATFDEVAALSVEGLNKSAIARVKRIAWNTVHRWRCFRSLLLVSCPYPLLTKALVPDPELAGFNDAKFACNILQTKSLY